MHSNAMSTVSLVKLLIATSFIASLVSATKKEQETSDSNQLHQETQALVETNENEMKNLKDILANFGGIGDGRSLMEDMVGVEIDVDGVVAAYDDDTDEMDVRSLSGLSGLSSGLHSARSHSTTSGGSGRGRSHSTTSGRERSGSQRSQTSGGAGSRKTVFHARLGYMLNLKRKRWVEIDSIDRRVLWTEFKTLRTEYVSSGKGVQKWVILNRDISSYNKGCRRNTWDFSLNFVEFGANFQWQYKRRIGTLYLYGMSNNDITKVEAALDAMGVKKN